MSALIVQQGQCTSCQTKELMFISANFHDTQKGPHMDFGSKTMKKQQQQVKSIVCLGTATRDGTGSKL